MQRKSDARQQRASYIASAQQGQRQESKPKEEPLLEVELKQEQKAYREPLLEVKYKSRHQAPVVSARSVHQQAIEVHIDKDTPSGNSLSTGSVLPSSAVPSAGQVISGSAIWFWCSGVTRKTLTKLVLVEPSKRVDERFRVYVQDDRYENRPGHIVGRLRDLTRRRGRHRVLQSI